MGFEYKDFIYELNKLFRTGQELDQNTPSELDDDLTFRAWRHDVTELIRKMNEKGYSDVCKIEKRLFGKMSTNPEKYFRQELFDTMTELDTILKHYKKYGAPEPNRIINVNTTDKNHGNINIQSWRDKIKDSIVLYSIVLGFSTFLAGFKVCEYLNK